MPPPKPLPSWLPAKANETVPAGTPKSWGKRPGKTLHRWEEGVAIVASWCANVQGILGLWWKTPASETVLRFPAIGGSPSHPTTPNMQETKHTASDA